MDDRGRTPRLLLLPLLLVVWGCALFSREPELLKRWDAYEMGGDTTGLVEVTAFTARSPATDAPAAVAGLSPSAQASYVRAMADRTSTEEELRRALAAPLGAPARTDGLDRTRFRRRLVISVERLDPGARPDEALAPVTRILRLRTTIGLAADRARFTSWDRFVTRYDTVELGTMEFTRSSGLELEAGLVPGAGLREAGPVDVGASAGAGLSESLGLRRRAVSNGILRPDSMVLLQEGTPGADLEGNSVVEMELRVTPVVASTVHRVSGLFDDRGRPRPADSVRLAALPLIGPEEAVDVTAELRAEALVRTVRRGGGEDTRVEADDRVRLLRDVGEASRVLLVPARELRTSVWEVTTSDCEILQIERPGAKPGSVPAALHFVEGADARRFLRWLRAAGSGPAADRGPAGAPVSVDGRSLHLTPVEPLTRSRIPELHVRLRPLNWSPGGGFPSCPAGAAGDGAPLR